VIKPSPAVHFVSSEHGIFHENEHRKIMQNLELLMQNEVVGIPKVFDYKVMVLI
jgi:NADPH-dependent 7-cyano-7-deazaguanine reductase QueF